jgi:hypothetical protein
MIPASPSITALRGMTRRGHFVMEAQRSHFVIESTDYPCAASASSYEY